MGTSADQSASVMGIRGKREKRFACLFTFSPLPITPFALSFFNNRPFSSCSKPLFQSEAKCEAIDFHKKSFALSLVLKVRVLGTQKWPIKSNWSPQKLWIASDGERGSRLHILYIPGHEPLFCVKIVTWLDPALVIKSHRKVIIALGLTLNESKCLWRTYFFSLFFFVLIMMTMVLDWDMTWSWLCIWLLDMT